MAYLEYVQPTDNEFSNYWADRPFLAGSLFTALIAVIGLVTAATRGAIKRQRINRSASALAVAGLVDPLLRLELVTRILGQGFRNSESACYKGLLIAAGEATFPKDKRLKWAQKGIRDPGYFAEKASHLGVDQKLPPEAHQPQEIVKECLNTTAAKVREWSGLLVLTDDGMNALFCLQSLRIQLQDLQRKVEDLQDLKRKVEDLQHPQRKAEDLQHPLQLEAKESAFRAAKHCGVISGRALAMAVAFEYASAPKQRRVEIDSAALKAAIPFLENRPLANGISSKVARGIVMLWRSEEGLDNSAAAWGTIDTLQSYLDQLDQGVPNDDASENSARAVDL